MFLGPKFLEVYIGIHILFRHIGMQIVTNKNLNTPLEASSFVLLMLRCAHKYPQFLGKKSAFYYAFDFLKSKFKTVFLKFYTYSFRRIKRDTCKLYILFKIFNYIKNDYRNNFFISFN